MTKHDSKASRTPQPGPGKVASAPEAIVVPDDRIAAPVTKAANRNAKRPAAKQFRFGFLVHDVSRIRRTVIDQILRPYGITRSQWSALSALSRSNNEGMMQVDLARLMEMGKVTVGGLIDRLEASGHVERRPDETDGRAKRVFITEQGFEVIGMMVTVASKMNKRMLKGLTPLEVETVERVLLQVKHNLKEMGQEIADTGSAEKYGSRVPPQR